MLHSNERTSLLAQWLVVEGAKMVWHVELTNKSTESVDDVVLKPSWPLTFGN
jgi:hypothetical protein